ncbi:MAG: FAD/NAD(P)-binding protein [Nitrospirae bacterium]|nr:FAD/NAD(P)-binding protein [Nitrospirota bacterium]
MNPLLPYEAVIQTRRQETAETFTLTLAFRDPLRQQEYRFIPGQFNMVGIPGVGEAPFSLSSEPWRRGSFDHTIRVAGAVTSALAYLKEGEVVGVRGPYGRPWPLEEGRGRDLLIAAGGLGLAPLRPVLEATLKERGSYGEVTVLYGGRAPQALLFGEDRERWERSGSIQILLTVDRPEGEWPHHIGVVTELVPRVRFRPEETVALLCGPEVMIRFTALELLKRRVSPDRIFVSLERHMRCAVGQCGHCLLGAIFVC